MKRIMPVILFGMMGLGLTACGGGTAENVEDIKAPEETVAEASENQPDNKGASAEEVISDKKIQGTANKVDYENENDVLVVYFSQTGTTEVVAQKIAAATGGDIYEIKAAKEYTEEDLNWGNDNGRATVEQRDSSVRPEIGSAPVDLKGYTTVYIGYPIWWGEEPRIMDTFVESNSFDGITVIPFCTSGSSDIEKSADNLAKNAGSGKWLRGRRFGAGVMREEIEAWVKEES